MNIAISGTTGFIGKHLCPLLAEKHTVIALVRNMPADRTTWPKNIRPVVISQDTHALTDILIGEKIDGIVHLATHFAVKHDGAEITEMLRCNVEFSTMLMDCAVNAKVKWFLNAGTFWQHYEGAEYSPVNLYAATKQAFSDIAKFYWQTGNIIFCTLYLNDTFGPGDTRRKIFTLWMEALASGKTLAMSPGEQMINILYIPDVVRAFALMVDRLGQNEIISGSRYYIAGDQKIRLKDLAAMFEKLIGKQLPVQFGALPYRPREVMDPVCPAEKLPGWQPQFTLEQALRDMLTKEGLKS